MIARIRKSLENREEGFTLIELLVVMIIIGILAAIAIPTFLNQRKNGWNSAAKTDVSNYALAVESSAVDKGGDFRLVLATNATPPVALASGATLATSGVLAAGNVVTEFSGSQGVNLYVGSAPAQSSFCIVGNNTSVGDPGGWWTYSKAKGGLQSTPADSKANAITAC